MGMLSTRWNEAKGSVRFSSRAISGLPGSDLSRRAGESPECRILDDVTIAELGPIPNPASSRPKTPRSRFGGDSRPCRSASTSAAFCFSARLAILRSSFSCSSCAFLARRLWSRSISSRKSPALRPSARLSTRLCALSVASGIGSFNLVRCGDGLRTKPAPSWAPAPNRGWVL